MTDNYEQIVQNNLKKLYNRPSLDLAEVLPSQREGNGFIFEAFGKQCRIRPEGISIGDSDETGVLGILISLYALHANSRSQVVEPLKSFRDFPDSMPYAAAFATHTEKILIPRVDEIEKAQNRIMHTFKGREAADLVGGDFSFLLRPLPKISLCYIFYLADEDFPASATCLYSSNASTFLPMDALADVGEYTSRTILTLLD
jgi:hypothetical protein